jgi:hypothetical protein
MRSQRYGVSWSSIAEYLQIRLAASATSHLSRRELRYRPALIRHTPSVEQADFWNALLDDGLVRAVVTTNYDLSPEQTIGLWLNAVPGSPGFHYGGVNSRTHPVTSPFGHDRSIDPHPRGVIPLFKLHGSLNWSLTDSGLAVFPDLRPAFRDGGDAAIVPPLPEKDVPDWLWPVWDYAEVELGEAEEWVIVGYSLPPYDRQIRGLFERAGSRVRRIRIYDPYAKNIARRWKAVAPDAFIETFPGLEPTVLTGRPVHRRLSHNELERRRLRALSDPRVRELTSNARPRRTSLLDLEAA